MSCGGLLRGESVNVDGRHVHLADVGLVFPANDPPPVLAGVTGPRSLAMAGSVADGVLLPEYSSPAYIEAARRLMANPTAAVTTYAWFHVDDDREAARAVRRSLTPTSSLDAQLAPLGLKAVDIASHVPDDVLDQLAVVGTPRDCAAALSALHDAGAGSVVVLPALDQTEIQVTRLAQEVVPLLR